MSEAVILDASALLSYLRHERGWERVEKALLGAQMSSVNYAEVLFKVAERGGKPEDLASDFALQLIIVPFTEKQALITAQLRPQTWHLGLSLGDRACLALGLERRASVLTADQAWQ